MSNNNNPKLERALELLKREMPRMVTGFTGMQDTATAEGALDSKTKSLAALAIAVVRGSDEAIRLHAGNALDADASKQEIIEAVGMAMFLGGEPAAFYGARAYAIIEELTANLKAAANGDRLHGRN